MATMVIWLYYGNIIVVSEENMLFLRFFRAISLVIPIVWMMITQLLRHLQINQAVGRPDASGWRDCRGGTRKDLPSSNQTWQLNLMTNVLHCISIPMNRYKCTSIFFRYTSISPRASCSYDLQKIILFKKEPVNRKPPWNWLAKNMECPAEFHLRQSQTTSIYHRPS
jgi:hypothetical protein